MKASRVEIRGSTDVVTARRDGRDMARALGFGSADQTRLATAISELTRNVV
ncbi:MAG: anti-sigma regulatory factor, partial [Myxococcota bacterium]|nr:anti-sigma regulatory factor [Myxococcota bacterium]